MKKSNSYGDTPIRPLPDDVGDETRTREKSGSHPGGKAATPTDSQTWVSRRKNRWKSMLAWLAKGAEHACPT